MNTLQTPTNSCFVTCLLRFDLAMSRYVPILFPCLLVNIACFFPLSQQPSGFRLGWFDPVTLLSRDLERSTSCSSTAEVQRARSQAWMAWCSAGPGGPKWPRNQSEIQCEEMQRTTIVRICQDVADAISRFADFLNFIKSVGCAQGEALPGKLVGWGVL